MVLLFGMVNLIKTDYGIAYECNKDSDRNFAGIDLMSLNKAPKLVLTRGKVLWSFGEPEGVYLSFIAQKFGVVRNKTLLTREVIDTESDAKEVKRLIPTTG